MRAIEAVQLVVDALKEITPPKIDKKYSDYCDYFCKHLDEYGALCNLFNHSLVEEKITGENFKRCPNCYKFTKLMEDINR